MNNMKIVKNSNEAEMILCYLKAELNSSRFKDGLLNSLKQHNFSQRLITNGNPVDKKENDKRRQILKDYRGYPDKQLFYNFPQKIIWKFVRFEENDIENIFYINYGDWNTLSNDTSSCLEAAKNIYNNGELYKPYLDGLKYLEKNVFDPIILITADQERYLIIEGHSRMTVYGLDPKRFVGTFGYLGICSEEEMINYDPRFQ